MTEVDKEARERPQRKEIEIPDTWVDVLMYPAGILAGAILATIVEFLLR